MGSGRDWGILCLSIYPLKTSHEKSNFEFTFSKLILKKSDLYLRENFIILKNKYMSGQKRIAVSELSASPKYNKLTGEAYLKSVDEELLEKNEGSKEDLASDKKEGVTI